MEYLFVLMRLTGLCSRPILFGKNSWGAANRTWNLWISSWTCYTPSEIKFIISFTTYLLNRWLSTFNFEYALKSSGRSITGIVTWLSSLIWKIRKQIFNYFNYIIYEYVHSDLDDKITLNRHISLSLPNSSLVIL